MSPITGATPSPSIDSECLQAHDGTSSSRRHQLHDLLSVGDQKTSPGSRFTSSSIRDMLNTSSIRSSLPETSQHRGSADASPQPCPPTRSEHPLSNGTGGDLSGSIRRHSVLQTTSGQVGIKRRPSSSSSTAFCDVPEERTPSRTKENQYPVTTRSRSWDAPPSPAAIETVPAQLSTATKLLIDQL